MKLKKILVNILVNLNSTNEINEKITESEIDQDILGFHVVLSNKIQKNFICDFIVECDNDVFWSIDKKQTTHKCLLIENNIHRCRIPIQNNSDIDLFIWTNSYNFTLKNVTNNIKEIIINDLTTININDINDKQFIEMFGFKKKYHFDHYRKLLILGLYEQKNDENQRFIVEMIEKIIINAKSEREFETTCDSEECYSRFFNKVFSNLLSENCGTLDLFSEYREKILKKLKSIYIPTNDDTKIVMNRKDPIVITKKIDLNVKEETKKTFTTSIFNNSEIDKKFYYQNVHDDVFIISEISRKRMFMEPENSIILFKYNNVRLIDIQETIEKIIKNCIGESYEIIFYYNQSIDVFEDILKRHDHLFKIKIISPKNKIVKAPNYSEIQKLIILSNMSSSINKHLFLVSVGSIFPKRYVNYINEDIKKNKNKELYILAKSFIINRNNGKLDYYEANTNNLFNYFIECIFPVIPKSFIDKLNFKSPIFGNMEHFKDFKNFLMKNGTINNVNIFQKLPDEYTRESLHVYEV